MSTRDVWTIQGPARIVRLGVAVWVCGLFATEIQGGVPPRKTEPPTFTRDVAPILRAKCQGCHRRDQAAPFCLETYEQARKRASDIAAVVADRSMPPWKPAPGVGPKLKHDRSLAPADAAVLVAWAEAGAPQGDAKLLRPPAVYAEGWALGTPDLVLELAESFAVPASGPDLYRCFLLPTSLPRDVSISAVEYRPGNRRVVHHMMAFIDTGGAGRARDQAEAGPGYTSYSGPGVDVFGDLGGWAAGNEPSHLPEGVGRTLPRGADVILQVHYHPSGKPEVDRTRIGLHFARTPVRQTLHWAHATNVDFKLPPGQARVEVKASWYVPVDVEALAVTPHMHQLGRDFRMTITSPRGLTRDLIRINDWDPSWQGTYYFEKPVPLPKGSTVNLIAHFDNSAHPRNPNHPPRLVRWGHEVTDEMCVGYIGVVKKGQDLTRPGERDDLFETLVRQHEKNLWRDDLARRRRASSR